MIARLLLAAVGFGALAPAGAATSVQMLTPPYTSVLGNEKRVYSVRFFNGLNQPAVGETVRFSNDACGFFQNGQFAVDVGTDTTGVASATFTARPQGIGCWITASAGASARFNVFTYNLGLAFIDGAATPADVPPGQPFTLTAGAYQGAYPIYEGDVTARVIPGSISATLSPDSGNMGQSSRGVDFEVVPEDRIGDFEVEVAFHGTVTRRFAFKAPPSPLQDMWWGGATENGWGMSVVQHRDVLFAVIYAYDADGDPIWYVMPGGSWNEGRTAFTGALYLPSGSPFSAYDASKLRVHDAIGNATIAFDGASRGTLEYTIAGVSGRRPITRQLFGPAQSGAPLKGLGDMWWGGAAQNGWGIAVLQQYKSLFAVWFTYDAQGKATWFVMPAGHWSSLDTYEGRIYRAAGPAWLGATYDASKLKATDAGSFRMRFSGEGATFEYSIDGVAGTMPLSRQPF